MDFQEATQSLEFLFLLTSWPVLIFILAFLNLHHHTIFIVAIWFVRWFQELIKPLKVLIKDEDKGLEHIFVPVGKQVEGRSDS